MKDIPIQKNVLLLLTFNPGLISANRLSNNPLLITMMMMMMMMMMMIVIITCWSVCGPVGVEDRNKIPDVKMTASTSYSGNHYPYYGRLNENRSNGGWCTKTSADRTDYLQVDMGAVHSVCAVATQGQRAGSHWITSYKVHLSTDGVTWNSYKENNVEKVTEIIYCCLEVEVYILEKS